MTSYFCSIITSQLLKEFKRNYCLLKLMLSRLTVGYIYLAKYNKMYPVQDCDLELYQHGHVGTPPKDYAFSFTAGQYFLHPLLKFAKHLYIQVTYSTLLYLLYCFFIGTPCTFLYICHIKIAMIQVRFEDMSLGIYFYCFYTRTKS